MSKPVNFVKIKTHKVGTHYFGTSTMTFLDDLTRDYLQDIVLDNVRERMTEATFDSLRLQIKETLYNVR
jgi:hypothetical protein